MRTDSSATKEATSNNSGSRVRQVVIFQYRLLHYRTKLFDQLRDACKERNIELSLVHGQATRRELTKKDEGTLSWAHVVRNRSFEFGERDLVWQPFPKSLEDANLIIVMQESRLLSNYPLLLGRLLSRRKVAYWGHGKNFQSAVPSGFRERWKSFLLKRVDWWFAYSETTVEILQKAGYPAHQITCLDNAIDTSGFKTDLMSWRNHDLDLARQRHGVAQSARVGLFCGSLYSDKRLDLLIEASDLIKQALPEFALFVIGDGPSMPQMRVAAQTRPWLHLLGVQTGPAKALYFRMADVILNPGAVGLHIVDAFCSSSVLVTTRSARHGPEVSYLRDGENGVFGGETPATYSQSVLEVIGNEALLTHMKSNALAASERYTLSNMVQRFANGIEAALDN
jgi:glycosyltransferase involved in cell wall biosynthesis